MTTSVVRLRKRCKALTEQIQDLLDDEANAHSLDPEERQVLIQAMDVCIRKVGLAWNATDQRWER